MIGYLQGWDSTSLAGSSGRSFYLNRLVEDTKPCLVDPPRQVSTTLAHQISQFYAVPLNQRRMGKIQVSVCVERTIHHFSYGL